MRLFNLRLLVLATLAQSLPVDDTGSSHRLYKRCGEDTPGWKPTEENWKDAGTTQFLKDFANNRTKSDEPLWKALANKYMSKDLSFFCQVGDAGHCDIPNYDDISTDNCENRNPIFALDSVVGLTTEATKLWNSLETAADIAQHLNNKNFVDLFTDHARWSNTMNLVAREFITFINYAIFTGLVFLPQGAAVARGLGTIIAGGVTSISSTISDTLRSDIELDQMANIGQYLANIHGPIRNGFANMVNDVLDGKTDASGYHFWDYADGAIFANWREESADFTQTDSDKVTSNMVVAGAINSLWKSSYTYIVASEAKNGDCNSDDRVVGVQKFCRDGDSWVYGIYSLPTSDDNNVHHHPVMPWGLDKLDDIGADIKIASSDVIESSIKAYHAAKFNYPLVASARWADAWLHSDDGQKPKDQGPGFEGVFSIPVCYDPSGNAFDTDSPKYPCQCGENGSETGAFQAATGFDQNTDVYEYGGCKITPDSSGQACDPLTGCGSPDTVEDPSPTSTKCFGGIIGCQPVYPTN